MYAESRIANGGRSVNEFGDAELGHCGANLKVIGSQQGGQRRKHSGKEQELMQLIAEDFRGGVMTQHSSPSVQ
jgi:hypothetical protein